MTWHKPERMQTDRPLGDVWAWGLFVVFFAWLLWPFFVAGARVLGEDVLTFWLPRVMGGR